jgi:quercetin dioxygenase-like cupin family protein
MRRTVLAFAVAAAVAAPAGAQEFKRQILQRVDVPLGVLHETVMGTAEIAPGGTTGAHTHFGVEMIVVLEGELDVMVDGAPAHRLKPGDSFQVPSGKVHDTKNVSDVPAKVVVTWMVEKGKPMAVPAPAK